MNKRNAALLDASAAQGRKESSDLEEEGTASEHEGEGLTDGMILRIICNCNFLLLWVKQKNIYWKLFVFFFV